MKKWKQMLCTVLAGMLLMGLPAQADSEIRVVIEGEEVKFDRSPVVEDGTTLVPFRVLFQRLGLAVNWFPETKTIVGKGHGVTIELQLDRKTGTINGREVELPAAPRIIDGATYVPLRLVGEATGRQVGWDNATRTITIGAAPSIDAEIEDFYRSFVTAGNAEDAERYLSAIHPESPLLAGGLFEAEVIETFRTYDVVTELEQLQVVEREATEAVLHTVETSVNTNGLFYPDSRTTAFINLVKDEAGGWKIYNIQLYGVEYLVPEKTLTADADIDADVEKAILDVIRTNLEATEAENIEAVMGTIDPKSPAYSQTRDLMGVLFLNYDIDYELELVNVIEVTDTDAYVYTVQTAKKIDGPQFADIRSKAVHRLKKQEDGSWKIYASHSLGAEPLN